MNIGRTRKHPHIPKQFARRLALATLLAALLLTLQAEGPAPDLFESQMRRRLVVYRFDFLSWELQALASKLTHQLVAPQDYMTEEARSAFLLDYLDLVARIQRLEWDINRVYTTPDVKDPGAETEEMRQRLEQLRQEQATRQPLAESIMEEQVATILIEEGFRSLGGDSPPVSAHFTPLPTMLIVSPRERIERIHSSTLEHGLTAAERERIEKEIYQSFDKSGLVTNIGGLSAYPAMLLESSSLEWIMDVTAHEWTHHYLSLKPLGWNYGASGETRTINETVASIVGQEVSNAVVARYYPHLLPPEPAPQEEEESSSQEDTKEPEEAASFDFRAEMRETRIQVDQMLAAGQIHEAEAYMEERREIFVEEGYWIRKLNQAYFAFHGAYADEPGAAGADPTGPAVRRLRDQLPDLYTFVSQVAQVTSLAEIEDLQQTVAD
jgi:hypothetical protein